MQKIPVARANRIIRALGKAKTASVTLEEYATTQSEVSAIETFQRNIGAIRQVVMDAPKTEATEKTPKKK